MQLKLCANPLEELSSSFLLPRALGLLKKTAKISFALKKDGERKVCHSNISLKQKQFYYLCPKTEI